MVSESKEHNQENLSQPHHILCLSKVFANGRRAEFTFELLGLKPRFMLSLICQPGCSCESWTYEFYMCFHQLFLSFNSMLTADWRGTVLYERGQG